MKHIRIVIAEDHPLVLRQLRLLLDDEFEVAGVAHTGREMVRTALDKLPDLVVADISMPEMSGLKAARAILAQRPNQKILFITNSLDKEIVGAAFEAGAAAFVSKPHAVEELRPAIAAVLEGRRFVSPNVAEPAPEKSTATAIAGTIFEKAP